MNTSATLPSLYAEMDNKFFEGAALNIAAIETELYAAIVQEHIASDAYEKMHGTNMEIPVLCAWEVRTAIVDALEQKLKAAKRREDEINAELGALGLEIMDIEDQMVRQLAH